jgi:hypothetical protein
MAAELDQLVGQFRYEAGPERAIPAPPAPPTNANGTGSRKPGNRIPYRRF